MEILALSKVWPPLSLMTVPALIAAERGGRRKARSSWKVERSMLVGAFGVEGKRGSWVIAWSSPLCGLMP